FIERMTLTEDRIEAMALGLEDVARQPDPINEVITGWTSPQGLNIEQKRVPLGVIGIIYESRPNVTADAAGLCFKAGNSAILRGGKETLQTNRAIVTAL
ncbi:gamma-glutamyl-phosphate reductase, partial [Aerococcus urinae]|nr:gamma-glutamyl-phosphate reductase [Aerococcus urinae]